MSKWATLDVVGAVRRILRAVEPSPGQEHLNRPFATAYQLAIELHRSYAHIVDAIGEPIGGQGTGQHTSLAQYVARELSQRIKSREIIDIEGAVLADRDLRKLEFAGGVSSSLIGSNNLSMFRLKAAPGQD